MPKRMTRDNFETDHVYDVGQACYEMGYREGGQGQAADWFNALTDLLPDGVEPYPAMVAVYIEWLHGEVEAALATIRRMGAEREALEVELAKWRR